MTKAITLLQEGQKVPCHKLSSIKIILFLQQFVFQCGSSMRHFIKLMLVGHTDTVHSVSMLNTALIEEKGALRGHTGRHSCDQKTQEAFFISLTIITSSKK